MQLLAAVEGDGATPLVEALIAGPAAAAPGDDRGRHHAVARSDLGPTARRAADRGVACVAVVLDGPAYGRATDPGASASSAVTTAAGTSGAGVAATKSTAATAAGGAAGRATTATMAPTALGAAGTTGARPVPTPEQEARALRHALAEYELPVHWLTPGRPLAEALAG